MRVAVVQYFYEISEKVKKNYPAHIKIYLKDNANHLVKDSIEHPLQEQN
jgi:hypothetical protein